MKLNAIEMENEAFGPTPTTRPHFSAACAAFSLVAVRMSLMPALASLALGSLAALAGSPLPDAELLSEFCAATVPRNRQRINAIAARRLRFLRFIVRHLQLGLLRQASEWCG